MTWTEIGLGVVSDTYDQTGTARLGEHDFLYRLLWNTRTGRWGLDLYTLAGVALIQGRPLNVGIDLLERCTVAGRPVGTLTLWRDDGTGADYLHDDLGVLVRLWYVEE